MTRDRGEYRAIYEALWDGKDWCLLTPKARLTWLALKGTLGACGIMSVPAAEHVYAARTGLPCDDVLTAFVELAGAGWIERDGVILWVRRGLQFEPSLEPNNSNHQKFVARHLASLPRLAIVDRFRDANPEWFPAVPTAWNLSAVPTADMPSEGPSDPLPINTTTNTPPTTPTPVGGSPGAREVQAAATELTAQLNRGLQDNPVIGTAFNPVIASAGAQQAHDWLAAGIPLAFAAAVCYQVGRGFQPGPRGKTIRSLLYCDRVLRVAWEEAKAREAAGQVTPPVIDRRSAPRPPRTISDEFAEARKAAQERARA